MTENKPPFDEKDVVWRWKPAGIPELPERIVVNNLEDHHGISMFWKIKERWFACVPSKADVAQLLRELTEAKGCLELFKRFSMRLSEAAEAAGVDTISVSKGDAEIIKKLFAQGQRLDGLAERRESYPTAYAYEKEKSMDADAILELLSNEEELRPIVDKVVTLLETHYGPILRRLTEKMSMAIIDIRADCVRRFEEKGFTRHEAITLTVDVWSQIARNLQQNQKKS